MNCQIKFDVMRVGDGDTYINHIYPYFPYFHASTHACIYIPAYGNIDIEIWNQCFFFTKYQVLVKFFQIYIIHVILTHRDLIDHNSTHFVN